MFTKFFDELKEARATVSTFTDEQIAVVRSCMSDMRDIINKYYMTEDEGVGVRLSECRRDYESQAYEDDLLDADQFDRLYKALEVFETFEAEAFA